MGVDKSRAALTSGETPLLLCGDEAELTSRAALTSGETPHPLCVGDQERRSGVSPLCAGTEATERRSGVSPLCAGTDKGEAASRRFALGP